MIFSFFFKHIKIFLFDFNESGENFLNQDIFFELSRDAFEYLRYFFNLLGIKCGRFLFFKGFLALFPG